MIGVKRNLFNTANEKSPVLSIDKLGRVYPPGAKIKMDSPTKSSLQDPNNLLMLTAIQGSGGGQRSC
jgi:hypothetical protein